MEGSDNVQIILNNEHVLNELWKQVDQGVEFESNSPAWLPDDFIKNISMVR